MRVRSKKCEFKNNKREGLLWLVWRPRGIQIWTLINLKWDRPISIERKPVLLCRILILVIWQVYVSKLVDVSVWNWELLRHQLDIYYDTIYRQPMCLSVNPQSQLWPSRKGLTETRGSDNCHNGAGLFIRPVGVLFARPVRIVRTYVRRSIRTTFTP
jgi:hypothetical protein